MREVKTYVAYNGVEFDIREECEEYEEYANDMIEQIFEVTHFYDEFENEIVYSGDKSDINDVLRWFENSYNASYYMYIENEIPSSAVSFIYNETGIFLPETNGKFYYDNSILDFKRSE